MVSMVVVWILGVVLPLPLPSILTSGMYSCTHSWMSSCVCSGMYPCTRSGMYGRYSCVCSRMYSCTGTRDRRIECSLLGTVKSAGSRSIDCSLLGTVVTRTVGWHARWSHVDSGSRARTWRPPYQRGSTVSSSSTDSSRASMSCSQTSS